MKLCSFCGQIIESEGWLCPACGREPEFAGTVPLFAKQYAANYEGYNEAFYEQLSVLEETSFWFRSRNRLILHFLEKYFPQARNFLEIGCGTGFVLSHIAQARSSMTLYGSEIYIKGLEYARKRVQGAHFFQMDARNIPFEQEFELIGIFDCLEHIEEDAAALRQINKALCPGGGLIVTVPQHPWLWSSYDSAARHFRRYAFSALKALMEDAGFHVTYWTSFVTLLFPLVVISRLLKNKLSQENDPLSELKLNKYINFLCEKVLDLERALITSVARMPFGSSLFVVARKL